MTKQISQTDAVILCGGLGTRLRETIGPSQKVLASTGDRPFLEILIRYLIKQSVRRIILCAGYQAEDVESFIKEGAWEATIEISKEPEPLGTGGAVKHARPLVQSDPFFVLNGDSFCAVDLSKVLADHSGSKSTATIVVSAMGDTASYGTVIFNDRNEIMAFREKDTISGKGWVNAGVYAFSQTVFDHMPDHGSFSLERDVFPRLTGPKLMAFPAGEEFIDIGTPERYNQAQQFFKNTD